MPSSKRGITSSSKIDLVDRRYLSQSKRVFNSRLAALGNQRVRAAQVRQVVADAEALAYQIEQIKMLDRTGLLGRLATDLCRLRDEFAGERLNVALREALGRQIHGGRPNKLLPYWYAVPALLLYMRYFYDNPRWDWIANWVSRQHGGGGEDARDWWEKVKPKTREDWTGLRPEKRILATSATNDFIEHAQVHYLDHHALKPEIKRLFRERWARLNFGIRCPEIAIERQEPCTDSRHLDQRLFVKLMKRELPFVPDRVLDGGRSQAIEIYFGGQYSGCSLLTIRTGGRSGRGRVSRARRA